MAESYKGLFLKLGLDGSPILSELEKVNKSLKGTYSEIDRLQKSLKIEYDAEKFKRAQELAKKSVEDSKNKVDLLKDAIGELEKQGVSKTSEEFAELKERLDKAELAAQKAKKRLEDINKIKYDKINDEINSLDSALNGVIIAGTAVATVLTAAGTAAYKFASFGADVTSEINDMSDKLGMTKQKYQELSYAFNQYGSDINGMTAMVGKFSTSLDELSKNSGKGTEILKQLGITAKDLQEMSTEDIFLKALSAMQGMESGYEKIYIARQLFGRQGNELMPILNAEKGTIEELAAQANELGIILSDDLVNAGDDLGDRIDTLKAQFKSVSVTLASELFPAVDETAEKFSQWLASDEGKNKIAELRETLKKTIETIIAFGKGVYDARGYIVAFTAVLGVLKATLAIASIIHGVAAAIKGVEIATGLAAKAQGVYNAVAAISPWGWIAIVVGAATAAILGYKIATGDAASESEKMSDKIREEARAYDELKESIAEKEQQTLSEIDNTERLYNELDNLSKKEEKTIDDKNRMKFCIDEINRVLPGAIDLIDSETMAYNVQGGAIDTLIAKKRALIMLESKEEAYKAAIKNVGGAQYNAQYYGDEANKLYAEAEELKQLSGGLHNVKSQKKEREANQALENYQTSSASYEQYLIDIPDYENAYADYIKQFGSINEPPDTKGTPPSSSGGGGSKSSSSPAKTSNAAKEAEQAAKEAEKAAKEARDKQFSDLKWNLDMGYITEAEYYSKLEELRDTFFEEGSSEWQKYTLDIQKYSEKLAKEEEENRKTQVKDYSDGIAERERLDKRRFDEQKARGELTTQDELDFLDQRAKNYRAYADITLLLEHLTAEEKLKIHKEYTEKAEDYELDAYLTRKKKTEDAEKEAEDSFQLQIQAMQDYHKLKTDGIKEMADFEKDNIKSNTDYAISQIKKRYEAEEKLLKAKLDGIDKEIEARRRLREDENQDDKIAKIYKQIEATRALIAYERDADNIINLQRQLERQQKDLQGAMQEKDDTAFYRQKESEKEAIQNQITQLRERADVAEQAARAKEQAAIIAAEREAAKQIQADAKSVQAQIKELNNEYFDYSNANYSYDSRTQTVVLQGATLTPAMLAKYFNKMG